MSWPFTRTQRENSRPSYSETASAAIQDERRVAVSRPSASPREKGADMSWPLIPGQRENAWPSYSENASTAVQKERPTNTRGPSASLGADGDAELYPRLDYSNHASNYSEINAGDNASICFGNNYDHQAHTGATASGNARQHNGNVINTNTYNYTLRQRRSDEMLREGGRNEVFLKAAKEGQTKRVEYLLRCGADIDHADKEGLTALHFAAEQGYEDLVEFLIFQGADVNAASVQYGTPLCCACAYGRANVVAALLQARADTLAPGGRWGSALHTACSEGHHEIVELLLIHNVPANLRRSYMDQKPVEPVVLAVKKDHAECVAALLDAGLSAEALCDSGYQDPKPLCIVATEAKAHSVLRLIASRGASLDQGNAWNMVALQFAIKSGYAPCDVTTKTLILLGANTAIFDTRKLEHKLRLFDSDLRRFIFLATRYCLTTDEEIEFQRICSPLCRAGEYVRNRRLQNLRLSSTAVNGKKYHAEAHDE